MLHVQESTHSTLLLASMLTPSSVHPQPTTSTSARTTRVVEQLQDTLDNLQKELISNRSQVIIYMYIAISFYFYFFMLYQGNVFG